MNGKNLLESARNYKCQICNKQFLENEKVYLVNRPDFERNSIVCEKCNMKIEKIQIIVPYSENKTTNQ